jgi:hypothetical protein
LRQLKKKIMQKNLKKNHEINELIYYVNDITYFTTLHVYKISFLFVLLNFIDVSTSSCNVYEHGKDEKTADIVVREGYISKYSNTYWQGGRYVISITAHEILIGTKNSTPNFPQLTCDAQIRLWHMLSRLGMSFWYVKKVEQNIQTLNKNNWKQDFKQSPASILRANVLAKSDFTLYKWK